MCIKNFNLQGKNMFKKVLSLVLVGLLHNVVGVSPASARSQGDKQARVVEKVKQNIRKLGVGEAARVGVRLEDGRKLKGYIREAGEDTFVVVDEKSGAATIIDYTQVKQVRGSNRLTAAKVALNVAKGVAIVAGVALAFTLLALIFVPKT